MFLRQNDNSQSKPRCGRQRETQTSLRHETLSDHGLEAIASRLEAIAMRNREKEARSSSFLILVAVPLLLVASSYRKVGGHVSISPEPPERPAALVMELVVVELIVTVLLVMVELVALTTKQTKSTCELL